MRRSPTCSAKASPSTSQRSNVCGSRCTSRPSAANAFATLSINALWACVPDARGPNSAR